MATKNGKSKKTNLGPWLLIGGIAIIGIGALAIAGGVFGGGSATGFGSPLLGTPGGPSGTPQNPLSGINPFIDAFTNTSIPMGAANSLPSGSLLGVQPALSTLQTGGIIPYQQNQFCDPTLGLYWNPLTGQCQQQLAGRNGQCAPGSVWNNCQCQCVPQGVAQPQCYRDCAGACPDKINQVWSWCTLGCIPKSAAYGDPGLLACPPLQGSSTSVNNALQAPGVQSTSSTNTALNRVQAPAYPGSANPYPGVQTISL